jgi:2-aminoadipate transaminase
MKDKTSVSYEEKFARRAASLRPSPLSEMLNLVSRRSDIISFAAGTPDIALLPTELLEEFTRGAIEKYGKAILQYGHTLGFQPLRETFAKRLAAHVVNCTADDIIISTGASGAINALCMALLDPGDTVLVENPTYTLALETFSVFDANIVSVPTDDEGMMPGELEKRLQENEVKFIYLLPNFQNPTGRTIATTRRQEIAKLAQKYNTLVLEDDIYVDLRYEGQHLPAIHSFAPDHTMYVSSVSKLFAPAMRLGISVLPPAILEKVAYLKPSLDFQTSTLTQALTNEFLTSDHLPVHLAAMCENYNTKREMLLAALAKHMPKDFEWTQPTGGMFVWVSGPADFDSDAFLLQAIERGIAYLPGSAFFADPHDGTRYFRLCFATPAATDIEPGVTALADALRHHLAA